jgi:hypothetical protein
LPNFGVGPGIFQELTTGTQNTAIGNRPAGGPYKLTTGRGSCETGSNNTFLGTNTQLYPGEQLIRSGEGTILEFDSSGNIIPSAGTYNTVSKIDTELSSLQSGVAINSVDITILLSGETVFTTSGSYSVPLNKTTLTIELMGGGGGGSSGGRGSDSAWTGGGGGGSGALEKITILVTNAQVIDFTIGVGETIPGQLKAQPTQSRGNGTATTVTMYGQTLLIANGGFGSTGIK